MNVYRVESRWTKEFVVAAHVVGAERLYWRILKADGHKKRFADAKVDKIELIGELRQAVARKRARRAK